MPASRVDKMVKHPESGIVATPEEGREEEEPFLKGEKEKYQAIQNPLKLLYGKCLNLWFWNKETGDHKNADHVLSVMKTGSAEIETVDVGAELWEHLNGGEIEQVLQAIGELTNLKWLHFSLGERFSSEKACKSLSIKTLSSILSRLKQVECIILKDVHLTGSKSDWIELTNVLRAHPSLMHIRLEDYSIEDSRIELGDFILSISCIQTLQAVEIFHHDKHQVKARQLPPSVLKTLLDNACVLQVLRLCGLDIGDDHIMELSKSLPANQVLRRLWLWQTKVTDKGVKSLSESLSVNKSIVSLNLNDNANLTSRGCQALFNGLRKSMDDSCSIKELYIGCQEMDQSCRQSLLGMIAKNISIERLEVCFDWSNESKVGDLRIFLQELKRAKDCQHSLGYFRFYSEPVEEVAPDTKMDVEMSPHLPWDISWQSNVDSDDDICMKEADGLTTE